MSSESDAPDHLDPAKWADMLGPFIFPSSCCNNIKPFHLGLVPFADSSSSLKIQDETERELVFQEKFVSIISLTLFLYHY